MTPATHCSFCEKPKELTPLLCVSKNKRASICGNCAMGAANLTMQHQQQVGIEFKRMIDNFPEMFAKDPETGAVVVRTRDDRLSEALEAARKMDDDKQEDDDEQLIIT